MKRKNVLGWMLILFGAVSLIFGWPWGSLVGAILVLAGVVALKVQPPQPPELPQPPPTDQTQRENVSANAEVAARLVGLIQDMEGRGEPIPDELIHALKRLAESGLDDWFESYDAVISQAGDIVVDFSASAKQTRSEQGWPTHGSIMGHPNACEEIDFVLTQIETLGGKVAFREGIFLLAILDPNRDGPEGAYLKERQRRGYPSLYDNEPHLEWSANPGFYERQLQRRHNNVLFPFAKRRVSQKDVFIARLLDADEAKAFREQWMGCLEKITGMPDKSSVAEMTDLLQELSGLLEKGASIGGDIAEYLKGIREAYKLVVASLYEAFENNQEATDALRTAEAVHWSSNEKLLNPFIAQVKRMQPDDLIPALLSEDATTIRLAVEVLGNTPEALEATRTGVIQLMDESPDACELLRQQPQKLEALGIAKEKIPT